MGNLKKTKKQTNKKTKKTPKQQTKNREVYTLRFVSASSPGLLVTSLITYHKLLHFKFSFENRC